jgi:hypothetical protein
MTPRQAGISHLQVGEDVNLVGSSSRASRCRGPELVVALLGYIPVPRSANA